MNELEQNIIDCWLEYYKRTLWPFVTRRYIAKKLNANIDNALRKLRDEKKVSLRRGKNDVLVMYMGDEEIVKENKNLLN